MGTSLIGKALGFGPNECRFESYVPNILIDYRVQLVNNLNIILSRKIMASFVFFSKKTLRISKILYSIGLIKNYLILNQKNFKKIKFSVLFYKNKPFFNSIRQVSTCSKKFYISYNALRKLISFSSSSIYILSTAYGLISHFDAIKYKVGGLLTYIIS